VARNWAALDLDQAMRIAPKKSDHAILGMHGDAIAISVLFGRGNDWSHRNILEFANSLKNIAHLSPFDCQLVFVSDVLISAAPAAAKVRAPRRNTIKCTFVNINKFAP